VKEQYRAVGRLLGTCLWHGKPLGVTFATAFCRQVLSAAASVELVVKTAKDEDNDNDNSGEHKPKEDDESDEDEEDKDDDEDAGSDDSSNSELGQFPASLGGGCLGYGAAWRVVRKPPAPAAVHLATAASVAACFATSSHASSGCGGGGGALSSTSSASSSSVGSPADDTRGRSSKRPRRNTSEPASTNEDSVQDASAQDMDTSQSAPSSISAESRAESTGKRSDGLSFAASAVNDASSSPWAFIGGARKACPEGECVLPASMLQCLGVQDGDVVVVTAPARARNRAGRLLLGPPGDKDLWLPSSTATGSANAAGRPGGGNIPTPAASAATVSAAFQKEVHCGWSNPSTTARSRSNTTCSRGNCCADCKATQFPVKDHSSGRARRPLAYSSSSSSNSGIDLSTVARSISWAIVPRLQGQHVSKRRQVVPRTGLAEAHDLVFLLALTQEGGPEGDRDVVGMSDDNGGDGVDDVNRKSTLRAEIARALGINKANDENSNGSIDQGAKLSERKQERAGKSSTLLPLLAAAGALSAPCVAKGARFGFRWCDADLELVVTEVNTQYLIILFR